MIKVRVRQDLLNEEFTPPTRCGEYLPEGMIKSILDAEQPELIEDDEFNMIVRGNDENGDERTFIVSSVDFDFINNKAETKAKSKLLYRH
ncbi:MAG: hypothetical protein GY730_06740 [bacterium]|nr:hypothetical protein [bacterium]